MFAHLNKRILYLQYFSILLCIQIFTSCSPDQTEIQIVRHPAFDCLIDTAVFQAKEVHLSNPSFVAVYPTDSSVFAYPYFRYTFQVSGFDEHHNQYFLAISFDAADTLHLANEYSSKYTNKGGLHEVSLYKIDSLQRIQSFSLKTDTADNLFAIDRQGINVRFLSGNFHFLLRNDQDTSEYLYIKQGSFQDIAY